MSSQEALLEQQCQPTGCSQGHKSHAEGLRRGLQKKKNAVASHQVIGLRQIASGEKGILVIMWGIVFIGKIGFNTEQTSVVKGKKKDKNEFLWLMYIFTTSVFTHSHSLWVSLRWYSVLQSLKTVFFFPLATSASRNNHLLPLHLSSSINSNNFLPWIKVEDELTEFSKENLILQHLRLKMLIYGSC